MTANLVDTYVQNRPYVLVTLTADGLEGTLQSETLGEARQLRRGMRHGLRAVNAGIRAEKRRLRLERAASRRDQQRTGAAA